VTLVGVLGVDAMLNSHSFRAYENAFSLITQVVGRGGRADSPGHAVIQTTDPGNPVLRLAARQDYDAFFEQEIVTRKALKAPPFANQFVFRFGGTDERAVQQAARVFADALASQLPQTPDVEPHVLGPVPSPIAKLNKRYFYTVSFRGRATNNSRALVSRMLAAYDRWPGSRSLTVSADIDPYYL
jgi:primosomal protein N' (replication factor Y)